MPCPRSCPAAFIQHDASGTPIVLCRVESTDRGQASAAAGPVSLVREATSPAALHGYCLGDLQRWAREAERDGLATRSDEERRIIAAALRSGADPDHCACPSWRAERDNTNARKLVDLPNTRRRTLEAGRAAA